MSQIFKHRPLAEFKILMAAWLALPATRLALRWMPLPDVRRRLWRAVSAGSPLAPSKRLPMGRIVRCAVAASKLAPYPPACLATALVVQALLARHGHSTVLKIGVRKGSGEFAAHAWLEDGHTIVIGGPERFVRQYTTLPEMEHLIA